MAHRVTVLRRRAFRGDTGACFALGVHLLRVDVIEERLVGYGFIHEAAARGHEGAMERVQLEEEMGGELRRLWERRQPSGTAPYPPCRLCPG